jgi:geranylgeranyl pyrophosphate synthase
VNLQASQALQDYIRVGAAEVEAALERYFVPVEGAPNSLHETQRYTLMAPGKRLRAVTTLACAELFRGDRGAAMPFAVAVEMVHASSLILDDLPSMDDATLRRGVPVLHREHGEASAILAAVGLLTRGFESIHGNSQVDAALRCDAAQRLARAIGDDGLVAGQIADLEATGKALGLGDLEYIHCNKTGALFIAAGELGALSARARPRDVEQVRLFAKNLGLAFQITDDLLDVQGSVEATGKDAGLDSEKQTFVDVCGVEGSHRLVDELIDASQAALSGYGRRAAVLGALAEMVRRRDR